MALYEMRTYTLYVGKLPEAVALLREQGWPVLEKGGFGANLVGYFIADSGTINRYFIADSGTINRLVHLWKAGASVEIRRRCRPPPPLGAALFDDDADRRRHWARLFEDQDFMGFAGQFRPLIMTQEVQLLNAAPWGPHP
jgi:hypothetical protein